MRRAARKDSNHAAIKEAFERLGCDVVDTSNLGDGVPDLLCRIRAVNRWFWVEIKTPTGKLKPAQRAFAERWPVSVVRDLDGVLEVLRG